LFIEYGVDDLMANYLSMALDLTAKDMVDFMSGQLKKGTMNQQLETLKTNYSKVMERGNFSDPLKLFNAIAIR